MKNVRRILALLVAACLCCTAFAAKKPLLNGVRAYPDPQERTLKVVVSTGKLPKNTNVEFYLGDKLMLRELDMEQQDDSTYVILVRSMKKWRPDSPATYTVTVKVGEEKADISFGFRQVSSQGGMIVLSDTTFLLKGINESAFPRAEYTTEAQWSDLFRSLMQEDVNFISLPADRISHDVLTAADKSGFLVHTTLSDEQPVREEPVAAKGKKKKQKEEAPKVDISPSTAFMRQYGCHPSLCLVSYKPGTSRVQEYKLEECKIFHPAALGKEKFLSDYSSMVDSTGVCLADLSDITDEAQLDSCLERALCTKGIGALMFSSGEQSKSYDGVQMLGRLRQNSWDTSEPMIIHLIISNNTDQVVMGNDVKWKLLDETGLPVSYGHFHGHRVPPRSVSFVGDAFSPLGGIYPGSLVKLIAHLEGTDISRTWTTRVRYPKRIRFLNERLTEKMKGWCKRLPGESEEDYRLRVNDMTKTRQRKLFATQICTEMAGDLMAGCEIRLKHYDAKDEVLTLDMGGVPPVKLKVPRHRVDEFAKDGELRVSDVRYGLQKKDEYEILYAKIFNVETGEFYIYDNMAGDAIERLLNDPRFITEQQMEITDAKNEALQHIRETVIEEARRAGLISEHTHVAVNNYITTDYNEKGEVIRNFKVDFAYDVDADYSAQEDFAPGRYRVEDSHAAVSLGEIIKKAFEKELVQYIQPGKQVDITITGSADASPIRGCIAYDGAYGDFENEPFYLKSEQSSITVTQQSGITENAQLAYIRAQGLGSILRGQIPNIKDVDVRYLYNIELPKGTGGKYRRIKVSVTFVDIF